MQVTSMRSYKSYFILILVPYLFLILVFHTQLQMYDRSQTLPQDTEEVGSFLRADFTLGLGNSNLNFNLLNSNGTLLHHEHFMVRKPRKEQGQWKHKSSGRFVKRKNLSHDLYLQESIAGVNEGDHPRAISENGRKSNGDANRGGHLGAQEFAKYVELRHVYASRNHSLSLNTAGIAAIPDSYEYAQTVGCRSTGTPFEPVQFQPVFSNFIYSAFYDNRRSGPAYIRVIALLKKADKPALFCHFPTSPPPHSDPKTIYISAMLTYYEMCENHGKDYGGWLLSCEVPASLEKAPCEIIISLHSRYNPQQVGNLHVPVILMKNTLAKKVDFGVCVPPLFGYIPSTTLIEFVELTKILGAQHIIFYAHQVPREIQKVLRYYESTGSVTVIPWELPVRDSSIWYHGQLLAINDCLYRNMHRIHYLAFNDLDEFIVPHRHNNWTEMIQHVRKNSSTNVNHHAGYSFHSAFFDPLIDTSSRVLYDLESDLRTKSFSKVRTKVMVDAEKIHELGIHHISKPLRDFYRPYYIGPEVAFLHHYRKCMTDFDPRMNCQVFARDESISQYIPVLRHNVHQTLWILKETEKLSYRDRYLRVKR